MSFEVDYSSVNLVEYKEILLNKKLVPSRILLRDNIDSRFEIFCEMGIDSVASLLKILKKRGEFEKLSQIAPLNEEYLKILLREIKSIQTKSHNLKEFDFVNSKLIAGLLAMGITNTKKLYPYILTEGDRKELSGKLDIDIIDMEYMARLCDLSRVQWVNSTFSRVLVEAGFDTLKKLKSANPEILYKKILDINKKRNIYRGNIGFNDIIICIEAANIVEAETDLI